MAATMTLLMMRRDDMVQSRQISVQAPMVSQVSEWRAAAEPISRAPGLDVWAVAVSLREVLRWAIIIGETQ